MQIVFYYDSIWWISLGSIEQHKCPASSEIHMKTTSIRSSLSHRSTSSLLEMISSQSGSGIWETSSLLKRLPLRILKTFLYDLPSPRKNFFYFFFSQEEFFFFLSWYPNTFSQKTPSLSPFLSKIKSLLLGWSHPLETHLFTKERGRPRAWR